MQKKRFCRTSANKQAGKMSQFVTSLRQIVPNAENQPYFAHKGVFITYRDYLSHRSQFCFPPLRRNSNPPVQTGQNYISTRRSPVAPPTSEGSPGFVFFQTITALTF